jgi:hypothetical protein
MPSPQQSNLCFGFSLFHSMTTGSNSKTMWLITLVAFNAFLRVGEMTSDVANNDVHCLQYTDVVVDKHGCVINFKSYKHSAPGTITKCVIKRQDGYNCPWQQDPILKLCDL